MSKDDAIRILHAPTPARAGRMRYHKSIYGGHKNLSKTRANSAESTMTKQSQVSSQDDIVIWHVEADERYALDFPSINEH